MDFTPLQPPLLLGNDGEVATGGEARPFALPTGTVTFLLTDVEGSTALWERDPDGAGQAIARHYAILDDAIAGAGGVRPVEQGEGDSVVGAFSRATDAVAAAVAAQRAFASELWPGGVSVNVRMAIHTGEAQLRDEGNYFGQTIIRCARLRACGHGGQILLSKTVADLTADRLPADITLIDLGHHRLKDLNQPEQVWQVTTDELASTFPPLKSLDTYRHNLPLPLTPLIGREAELAELGRLLEVERMVTLTGSGGCGKTRLASELGARIVDRFDGGIAWVELAPRTDAPGVTRALASVLKVDDVGGGQSLEERIVATLRTRPATLIVLDNAEHVLDATADLTAALLIGIDRARIVCTSREPLGVPGEVVWRVPSLSAPRLDGSAPAGVTALSQFDAVRLFIDRATRARRGFAITDANAPAIAQICSRLDGVPLAVELAAARVRTLPPERIAAQLDDRFRLLAGGPRTLLPRQQTLQASVSWSEGLLDPTEQAVFRRLGVFVGGFTAEAAEGVVGTFDDVDAYDVIDAVGRLVDKSLVVLDEQHDRYVLLETIRSYALQRLLETGETDAARDAHAGWIATWLESMSMSAPDLQAWMAQRRLIGGRIDPDWPNCAGALDRVEPGSALSLRIVAALGMFWLSRQMSAESGRYGMPALERGDRTTCNWLTAVVELHGIRTNAMDTAYDVLRAEALQLAVELDDELALSRLRGLVGSADVLRIGPTDDILAAYATGRETARRIGDWYTLMNGAGLPMNALAIAGRIPEAEALMPDVSPHRALFVDAGCRIVEGRLGEAGPLLAEAEMELRKHYVAPFEQLMLLTGAAHLALVTGSPEIVRPYLDGTLLDLPRPGAFVSVLVLARGYLALIEGDLLGAKRELSFPTANYFQFARRYIVLAQVELALGDTEAARAAIVQLRACSAHVSAPLFETTAHLVLAECDVEDDLTAALDQAHQALAVATEHALWLFAVDALEGIGAMLHRGGRERDAARLLAAAQAERDRMGYRYRFAHRAAYVGTAHEALAGSPAWDEGAVLALSEAIELAQRMRGERIRPSSGWDSLTPTERQVVDAVVAGHTNPQIAERLLMSRATVKSHLAHIFTKLAISTRAELAAQAARRRG